MKLLQCNAILAVEDLSGFKKGFILKLKALTVLVVTVQYNATEHNSCLKMQFQGSWVPSAHL